jgi:hypothetical protein
MAEMVFIGYSIDMNIGKVFFALFVLVFLLVPGCSWLAIKQSPTFQTSTPALTKIEPRSASDQTAALFMQCNSPCWLGITPGQTTRKDAIEALKKHYGHDNVRSTSIDFVKWASNGDVDISNGGDVSFLNNVVADIYVWIGADKLSIRDLVQILGEPDLVFVAKTFTVDTVCISASVFYSAEGIVASLYPVDGKVGIQETQYVSSLSFLSPQLSIQAEPADSFIANWEGFRDYCLDN